MDDLLFVKFFKYLGWILYLGLFLTAILFTREAMDKFFSGDTGITHYQEKIDFLHPTIIICLGEPGDLHKYGMDFNITYTIIAEDYFTYIRNRVNTVVEFHAQKEN